MAEQWIIDLTKQLEHPPSTDNELWTKSIYRVPKILTDVNRQAYEPRVASFGPYRHGRRHLRSMEHHKHRALIQFLRRIGKASKSPNDVLVAMKKAESCLRFAYNSLKTEVDGVFHRDWTKDDFLKPMITDGCFALEFMLSMMKRFATEEQSEYDSNNPVFGENGNNYVVPNLKRDMLPNQVTAYASFMNGLIRTTDDVALLRKEDIITGLVGCDSNIVSMFSRIAKESTRVVYIDVIQIDVIGKLADYCKKNMHKWRAR
ncbi:hypothetical protein KSP40_PGU005540 [Platanthera guangdongensis]|uniref:Uncharacterized protein n=1 Tax=Platanthera guangdongensis TaxID=2320717 RepID=A0ABR2MNE2_9ASPA